VQSPFDKGKPTYDLFLSITVGHECKQSPPDWDKGDHKSLGMIMTPTHGCREEKIEPDGDCHAGTESLLPSASVQLIIHFFSEQLLGVGYLHCN
jgi:hypothetical protein